MIQMNVKGLDTLNKSLKNYLRFIDKPKAFFHACTVIMRNDVKDHFAKEQSPEGKWKKSRRAIRQKGKTLQNTRNMFNSIQSGFISTEKKAEIGTNIKYASKHNFGLDGMTKREFMWLSSKALTKIGDTFMYYLKGVK